MRGLRSLLVVAALAAACSSPREAPLTPTEQPVAQPTVQSAALANPTASPAKPLDPNWTTYQHDLARSGQTDGAYNPPNLKQLWQSDALDGLVYGEVLVAGNHAFAVTQNNTVFALEVSDGKIAWSHHLGDPVPRSALPCGNVDPTGILSTPVVDPSAGLLYLVDYLNQPPHHQLVALDLNSGSVRFDNPIDPPDANPLPLQQRAPLSLDKGNVYVPYGGLLGDCGEYHGWVVSAGAPDGHQRAAYAVPTNRGGAIWSAPALDRAGDLYVATGNGDSTTTYDGSNAVIRLSSDLKPLDFFAPLEWADLNRRDADLGSAGPILLDDGQILQVGKSGVGYLLNGRGLGEIGGDRFQAPVCSGGAYGGTAHVGAVAYVACRNGVVAIAVANASFSVLWHGPQFAAGAPLVTDDAVWTLDDGTSSLYALNPKDGSVLFREPAGQATNPPHFVAPSAAGGRIFHPRANLIVAFAAN